MGEGPWRHLEIKWEEPFSRPSQACPQVNTSMPALLGDCTGHLPALSPQRHPDIAKRMQRRVGASACFSMLRRVSINFLHNLAGKGRRNAIPRNLQENFRGPKVPFACVHPRSPLDLPAPPAGSALLWPPRSAGALRILAPFLRA